MSSADPTLGRVAEEAQTFPADRLIAIAAFRYALGRMTYMPSHVAQWLEQHKDKLSDADRALIALEINEAAEHDTLGHECDRAVWLRLRDSLTSASDRRER